ncbi:MAG: GAF domain-containing protein [Clostridiales bacterium]|jgi:GAF domain-containing protein|nr:GAF domain-containing protein [Clostridiales bacterium]
MFAKGDLSIEEAGRALIAGETDIVANLANLAALIPLYFDRINWGGFYLLEGNELVLGPFQGKPACVRIPLGKGVCGTAAAQARTIIVDDVDAFPGHIACDGASRSEVVAPIIKNGKVLGVLDVDSPELTRFSEADAKRLEALASVALEALG